MLIRNTRNFILLRVYKTLRFLKTGKYGKSQVTKKERTLRKIIRGVLQDPENRVLYSPESYRIFAHNKTKTYIISFDDREIRITNHKFFSSFSVNPEFGRILIREAYDRIENDLRELESESVCNEDFFLNEVCDNLTDTSTKKSKVQENFIPENSEKYFQELMKENHLL